MSDVYIWKTCGLFSIVFAFIVLLLLVRLPYFILCVLFVSTSGKALDWNRSEEMLHSHLHKFQPFGINTCANTISRHCFRCRNRSAFSSSYQKRCYAIPIGHHKVMIKHFSKFIVESRASFLNEFLTLYHEEANKTREKRRRQMDWERRRYGLCTGWEASVSQNLRLIFDCIFVTLAIIAFRNAVSHTHLLNSSLVNSRFIHT